MKKTLKTFIGALMLVSVAAMAPSSFAQDSIMDKIIPSLEYQQADVREALKALFKQVDASYSISQEIQGYVTTTLKNVRFETALQNILAQVNATYRFEAGVFVIIPKPAEGAGTSDTNPNEVPTNQSKGITRKIYIRSADPMFIAMLIGTANGSQQWLNGPEPSSLNRMGGGGGMGMGGMMGGMGGMGMGGMMGGMGGMGMGGMMGGMGGMGMGGMMGGMGGMGMGGMGMGGMGMGGMGGGMGMGGMGGGMGGFGGFGIYPGR